MPRTIVLVTLARKARGVVARPDRRKRAYAPKRRNVVNVVMGQNSHIGSSFESWLDETGLRDEVTVAAIKAVIARQLAEAMKNKRLSKRRMAKLMKTSRTQVTRLLDPVNGNVTLESLQRAARIVGCALRIDFV